MVPLLVMARSAGTMKVFPHGIVRICDRSTVMEERRVHTVGGASTAMSGSVIVGGTGAIMLLLGLVRVVQTGSGGKVVGFQRSLGAQLLAVTQMVAPSATPVNVCEFMHGRGVTVATKMPPAYTWYDLMRLPPSNPCNHMMVTV